MSAYSKIFIASKPVLVPGTSIDTTKDHLYLIYDLNGDGNNDGDQFIIRGGPESENGGSVLKCQTVHGHGVVPSVEAR